jgi:cob(I)alamin adenosyltransferase
MVHPGSSPTRESLQALFARAAARRAERRVFVATLRRILERRLTVVPLLLLKLDRRRTPREA